MREAEWRWLLGRFEDHLKAERGLAPLTVRNYRTDLDPLYYYLHRKEISSLQTLDRAALRGYLAWLSELDLPLVVAATKADRLKPSARRAAVRAHQTALGRTILPISAKLGDGLPAFWTALLELTGA